MTEFVDFMGLAARQKIGASEDWGAMKWSSIGVARDMVNVTGAVMTERYKRGPRKGRLNWSKRDKKTECTVTVSSAEIDAAKAAWSLATGKCACCRGRGTRVSSISIENGTTYRQCESCNGSGEASP